MLIVYAHPNKEGHAGKILREVVRYLEKKKINYKLLDLYDMNYDPVMYPHEHYTSGGKELAEVNQEMQKLFKEYDKFIFIYPTWWNNIPAILKGFIDKVFTGGYAFRFKGKFPIKLLKGKALVFTTTGGPWIYSKMINRSLKLITKDTLGFCGIKAKGYLVGDANKFNDKQKAKIEKLVPRAMRYLA